MRILYFVAVSLIITIISVLCLYSRANNFYKLNHTYRVMQFDESESCDSTTFTCIAPVYKFKSSPTGEFMQRFTETIADNIPQNYVQVLATVDSVNIPFPDNTFKYPGNIDEYAALYCIPMDTTLYPFVKGVFITESDRIGIISNNSKEWLNLVELEQTDLQYTINCNHHKTNEPFIIEDGTNNFEAFLKFRRSGKVDPINLFNNIAPIQYSRAWQLFDWIEDFYLSHCLESGCGYYQQKPIGEKLPDGMIWMHKRFYPGEKK